MNPTIMITALSEVALRFMTLLGPISAFVVFERITIGEEPKHWVPLLIFSIIVNLLTVAAAVAEEKRKVRVDIGNALDIEAHRKDPL